MTLRASSYNPPIKSKGMFRSLTRKSFQQYKLLPIGIFVILLIQASPFFTRVSPTITYDLATKWNTQLGNYVIGTVEVLSSLVNAVFLFSYLHKKNRNHFFHSIPCTRDQLFLSSYSSGLLFYALPWFLVTGFSATIIWFLKGDNIFLFTSFLTVSVYRLFLYITFYSFSVMGMVLSGRSFFGILSAIFAASFLPVIEALLKTAAEPLLFGLVIGLDVHTGLLSPFSLLSPIFSGELHFRKALLNGGVFTLASLLLSFLALLLHRKRQEEAIGKSLVFPSVLSLLQVFLTLVFSFILEALIILVSADSLSVLVLIPLSIPAFFLARMLLMRTRKVFQKKALLGCLGYVFVLSAFLLTLRFDLLGIVHKVPEADRVQSVSISPDYEIEITSQTSQDIQDVISIHEAALAKISGLKDVQDQYDYTLIPLHISYTVKEGKTLNRTYYLSPKDTHAASKEMISLLNHYFRQADRLDQLLQTMQGNVTNIKFVAENTKWVGLSTLQQQELFRLLRQDMVSGAIDPLSLYIVYGETEAETDKHIRLYTSLLDYDLYIPADATATLDFLAAIEGETFPGK